MSFFPFFVSLSCTIAWMCTRKKKSIWIHVAYVFRVSIFAWMAFVSCVSHLIGLVRIDTKLAEHATNGPRYFDYKGDEQRESESVSEKKKKKRSVKRAIGKWTEVASRKVCCQQQTTMASDFIFVKTYFVMHSHSLLPSFYMLFKLFFTLISQYCRELIFSYFFFISNHKHK